MGLILKPSWPYSMCNPFISTYFHQHILFIIDFENQKFRYRTDLLIEKQFKFANNLITSTLQRVQWIKEEYVLYKYLSFYRVLIFLLFVFLHNLSEVPHQVSRVPFVNQIYFCIIKLILHPDVLVWICCWIACSVLKLIQSLILSLILTFYSVVHTSGYSTMIYFMKLYIVRDKIHWTTVF